MPQNKSFQITAFSYQELSEKAKQKAHKLFIEWRSETWDELQSELISDWMKEELQAKGYPTDRLNWCLSNQQGDGVAFYGRLLDENIEILVNRLMADRIQIAKLFFGENADFPNNFIEYLEDHFRLTIYKVCPHYDHWNSMRVSWETQYVDDDDYERFNLLFEEFLERLLEDVQSTSKELEKGGQEMIDSEYSEQSLIEMAEANQWWFDADGNLIHLPSTATQIRS